MCTVSGTCVFAFQPWQHREVFLKGLLKALQGYLWDPLRSCRELPEDTTAQGSPPHSQRPVLLFLPSLSHCPLMLFPTVNKFCYCPLNLWNTLSHYFFNQNLVLPEDLPLASFSSEHCSVPPSHLHWHPVAKLTPLGERSLLHSPLHCPEESPLSDAHSSSTPLLLSWSPPSGYCASWHLAHGIPLYPKPWPCAVWLQFTEIAIQHDGNATPQCQSLKLRFHSSHTLPCPHCVLQQLPWLLLLHQL